MKRFIKVCLFIAVYLAAVKLIVEYSEENKRIRSAQQYVLEKYGFMPKVQDCQVRSFPELKNTEVYDAGYYITMEYAGHVFETYMSRTDPKILTDNYMQERINDQFKAYFAEKLKYDDIEVWTSYGEGFCCGIPKDIKTYNDVITNCKNLKIYVSTYGLDRDKVKSMDFTEMGDLAEIYIFDCESETYVRDEEAIKVFVKGRDLNICGDFYNHMKSIYQIRNGFEIVMEE